MGNTCAAYWMPPIAVIAPTMIANGGSVSNGMCFVITIIARVFRVLKKKKKNKAIERKQKEERGVCVLSLFFSFFVFVSALFFFVGVFFLKMGKKKNRRTEE